jgi:hypothetical protein
MRISDIQKVTPEYKGSSAPMHGVRNEESPCAAKKDKKS